MAASLEKKAEKNIIDSIDKLVTSSFLMLLFEGLMVKNHPVLKDALNEKCIKGIYDYLNLTTANLRHIIDESGDQKEFHLRKSLQMKEKLLEVYDIVKIYISACNLIDLCMEDSMRTTEEEKDSGIPLPELKRLLVEKAGRFMDDAVEHDIEEAASAILFTLLPNHFSDRELLDYVVNSAKFYYDNSSQKKGDNHVAQIMRSFSPQRIPEYGKCYPKEAKKLLDVIEAVNASGLDNNFKRLLSKYDKIYSRIEGIADLLSSLYTELTYISIILSSMFTFDDILKDNPIYSDFYNKAIELLTVEGSDEVMSEALLTSLDKTIEKEVEQLNELAKRKELIYKNVNFENFSENTKTLFSMEFFMTSAFFENIDDADDNDEDAFDIDDKIIADLKTIQKKMRVLKLFIKENCLGMNETLKNAARRNVFLSVPLVSFYDKEKMLLYIDKLCEKVDNASEIESVLTSVEKIIEEDILQKLSFFEH